MANKKKATIVKEDKKKEESGNSKLEKDLLELENEFGLKSLKKDKVESTPSGSYTIDRATGIGGLPNGKIVELWGQESSGKSTIVQHAMASYQKCYPEKKVAYMDFEYSLDPVYAAAIGVDMNKLLVYQPDNQEQGYDMICQLIEKGIVSLVVIDSHTAATPKKIIEGEMGDSVTYDTPIYIRNKNTKLIEIVPIKDLYKGGMKFFGKRYSNIYKKTKRLEVLTHKGWSDLNAVFFKKNIHNKVIKLTHTTNGYVKTTGDHCLFKDGEEIKADELAKGDLLDIFIPKSAFSIETFDSEIAYITGLWCGDGSIYRKKTKHRNSLFEYTSIDKNLIDKIKSILERKFGITVSISFEKIKGNRRQLYKIIGSANIFLKPIIESAYSSISDLKKVPIWVLNGTEDVKKAFIQGFWESDGNHGKQDNQERAYYNNSLSLIAGIQFILNSLDTKTGITFSNKKHTQITLGEIKTNNIHKPNEVKRILTLPEKEEYIYDIETSEGTFVTALGNIVLHNSTMAVQARNNSKFLAKIKGPLERNKTTLIGVSQTRVNIGGMGDVNIPTGGNAWKFYSDMRFKIWKALDKENESNRTTLDVVKNKCANPFGKAEFDILWGVGCDNYTEIIDMAIEKGIVKRSGAWYSYKGDNIGQGKEAVKQLFKDNPELFEEIKNLTLKD